MKKHIFRIAAFLIFSCGLGCTKVSESDFSEVSLEGTYKVKKVSVSSKQITGPIDSTSLLIEKGGRCVLTDWPMSSLAIISPGGARPKDVGDLQGEWMVKKNSGKYEIELQVRESPAQSNNILIVTIISLIPLELKSNIDVGSDDDFMILEKTVSDSVKTD